VWIDRVQTAKRKGISTEAKNAGLMTGADFRCPNTRHELENLDCRCYTDKCCKHVNYLDCGIIMDQRNCGYSIAYCVMVEGDCPSCETFLCPGVTNNTTHTLTRVVTSTSTNTHQIVIGLACDS
jgi:hypothetical protein